MGSMPPRSLATSAALALAVALTLAPRAARPEATTGCHCFRDRTFDPARPGAADDYILATARSSLLSAAFGVAKRQLVVDVMGGTPPEDLWIAHWAAARTKRTADALLAAKKEAGAWRRALPPAGALGEPFDAALARGAPDAELAALAVDDVLATRVKADPKVLHALRAAGASTEEVVVATVLSAKIAAPVLPLLVQVKAGRATWGSVLADSGIEPGQLDGLVRTMVR